MADLTSKRRNSLPSSNFGMTGSRKYPMPDKAHARNAKARASEMYNKGQLSASAKAQIDRKANSKLGKKLTGKHPADGGNGARGKMGRGHDQPGLGSAKGSKVHGGHKNVVNPASHADKMKSC